MTKIEINLKIDTKMSFRSNMRLIFILFCRERVVHLLAVRPLKKPELLDRMARGKTSNSATPALPTVYLNVSHSDRVAFASSNVSWISRDTT